MAAGSVTSSPPSGHLPPTAVRISYGERTHPILVLARKPGDRIFLGDDIVITIVEIDRGKVRVGILAPKALPVMREEIADAPYCHFVDTIKRKDAAQ